MLHYVTLRWCRQQTPRTGSPAAGCIGAGKSTTATRFVAHRFPDRDFVEVDSDDVLDFHPLGADVWRLHDMQTGAVVPGAGHIDAYFKCREQLMRVLDDLVDRELLAIPGSGAGAAVVPPPRYDVILHGHRPELLQHGARVGFHTVALFIAVPRPLNLHRMRARAQRTGRHWDVDGQAAACVPITRIPGRTGPAAWHRGRPDARDAVRSP